MQTCGLDCWFDLARGTEVYCADAVLVSADVGPMAVQTAELADTDGEAAALAAGLALVDAAVMPRAAVCLNEAVGGME